jgi:hypothetical protein
VSKRETKKKKTSSKTLQTETSYVVGGKEINRDIESSGERNQ